MIGRVLAGRYQLAAKLGQGGMGSVWRARHLTLQTDVAVKLIDPAISGSQQALARFAREAVSAAGLHSAHIVRVMDYGVDEDTPFIAMELLDGENLGERLEKVGRFAFEDVKRVLGQMGRALTVAHGKGVVHRDLKPENVFLTREGDEEVVKVLDFGIAKRIGTLSLTSDVRTGVGALLGTPCYMSPEQAAGETSIDHRTDIWSLGIIAYELATGQRPFRGDNLGALLIAICIGNPVVPSEVAAVPDGFDDWFARATARERSRRFQSAAEAISELKLIGCVTTAPLLEIGRVAPVPNTPTLDLPIAETASQSVASIGPSSVTFHGIAKKPVRRVWIPMGLAFGPVAVALVLWGVVRMRTEATPTTSSPSPTSSPLVSHTMPALAQVAAERPSAGATEKDVAMPTSSSSPAVETSHARLSRDAAAGATQRSNDAAVNTVRNPDEPALSSDRRKLQNKSTSRPPNPSRPNYAGF